MNIPEAIKLLQQDLDDPGSVDITDLNRAQALGIEALERVQYEREYPICMLIRPLPSETED